MISSIPWLHLAQVVAEEAAQRGNRRVAVLGTRLLMEGQVYAERLDKAGIEQILPEADDRTRMQDIILTELIRGLVTRQSQIYLYDAITRMKASGCEAVILGCTELPLLIGQEDFALPILDSTRLLARAAVMRATS